MKRYFYILCFVILGVILQQIVHSIVEMLYINLLLGDFETFGFGWQWSTWLIIHHIYGIVLFVGGALLGYWQGKKWWPKLYDENGKVRYPKPWRI